MYLLEQLGGQAKYLAVRRGQEHLSLVIPRLMKHVTEKKINMAMMVGARKRRRTEGGARSSGQWPPIWQVGAAKRFRNEFSRVYPRGSEMSLNLYGPTYAEANVTQKDARKMTRFKGHGDYKAVWKKNRKYIPRMIGAAAGRALGYGAGAGYEVGGRVSKAIGWGDYKVNQIVDSSQQNIHHVSVVNTDLSGDIIYSNTEFVKNIYATITSGSSPFHVDRFDLNPALLSTFPFLSQIAQNFELYEFQGLLFQYKPTSGEFGSNNSNALGKVVLCTNYDPDAANFTSSIVMENYDYACSTKPSSGCVHGVECKPSQRSVTQLYTRTGDSTKQRIFTDLGSFQIASEGIPSSVAQDVLIGELWVTYTVKLSRAKLFASIGESILHAAFQLSIGTNLGNKTVSADSDNTMALNTLTPNGLEIQFPTTGGTATTKPVVFGNGYQGKRILVTTYSNLTITANYRLLAANLVNCTLISPQNASNGTAHACTHFLIQMNTIYSGTAGFDLESNVAPSGTQVDLISMTVVDPQFSLVVDS